MAPVPAVCYNTRMAGTKYPPVVVVDENDCEVGSAMLATVWRQGLYHRIVSVFVVDDAGMMLLQRRSAHVNVYPNCWDQAAGGHVDEGSSYGQTAADELSEELGIRDVALQILGTFRTNNTLEDGRIINQFERAYLVRVPHGIMLSPDPEEVDRVQWITMADLKLQITQYAADFTPGLLHALQMVLTYLGNQEWAIRLNNYQRNPLSGTEDLINKSCEYGSSNK